jgi:hypothetical protein
VQQPSNPSLQEGLAELDRVLSTESLDDFSAQRRAVKLVERLRDDGKLKAYGAARQKPKRLYTLDELRLHKIDSEALLSPQDETLSGVQSILQVGVLIAVAAVAWLAQLDVGQTGALVLSLVFLLVVDQIRNMGGGQALVVDTLGRILKPHYA